ncbi:MAG: transglycosylase domain-containing protein [Oscillospiraceae bacterium]|nr:transglycosylase domain-containing protein [Oscillospiraceae bacterium]
MNKKFFSRFFSNEQRKKEWLYNFYKGQKPPENKILKNLFIFYRVSGKIISVLTTALVSLLLIFTLTCTIVGTVTIVYILSFTNDVKELTLTEPSQLFSTYIYTTDSETGEHELVYRKTPSDRNIRIKKEIDDLPDYVKYAFVCVEDERFYSHDGVDYKRTAAAVANLFLSSLNLSDSYFGGSTITQQLIKNVTGDNEDTWDRKMREIFTAMKLEKRYTKDEILEAYLNEIYFDQIDGYNMYGIEAASIGYFGKTSSELTIAEAAALAAIPKSPNYYNISKNYENNHERKLYCLMKMFELGIISAEEYEQASNEKILVTSMDEFHQKYQDYRKFFDETDFENPDINSDTVDLAIMEFTDYLMEKHNLTSRQAAINMFNNGGYTLYLSVNNDIQSLLERRYADWYNYFPQETTDSGEKVQSAFTVMDYEGHILGLIGRIGDKPESLCWNNAYSAHRQCGSTIKPVSTYGYALEYDYITWSKMFQDSPIPAGVASEDVWPQNYDGDPTGKTFPVNYFLKRSINTLPAQICYNIGIDTIFKFTTEKFHLDLDPIHDRTYSALAVGGTFEGPTLLNLTNSYIPYGNGGKYYKASIIAKAVDSHTGEIIIDNENREGERAVSEETAYVMNKLLQNNVIGQNGTGGRAKLDNKEIGGKTGTSENWRDIAFIGLTPDFVSGVWIGYENGTNPEAIENANSAGIWYNIFGEFADSYESKAAFPECKTVIYHKYCSETGLLATEYCPSTESGYYKSSNCAYCNEHKQVQKTENKKDNKKNETKKETTVTTAPVNSYTQQTTVSTKKQNPTHE